MLLLCVCLSPASLAAELFLTTENTPPMNMLDPSTHQASGISVDKVVELMRRAKQAYSISFFPWARAYQMAVRDMDTCVFSTTRTTEREDQFQWVGPLATNDWVVFGRADDAPKPKKIDDLRGHTVGSYLGDAIGDFLIKQDVKVNYANADENNPEKLILKRIDYWATGRLLGQYLIQKKGLQGKIVPLFAFNHTDLYLACQLGVDKQQIDLFNRILRQMDADGTSAAIERKYQ